jgi:hypothetical protein
MPEDSWKALVVDSPQPEEGLNIGNKHNRQRCKAGKRKSENVSPGSPCKTMIHVFTP